MIRKYDHVDALIYPLQTLGAVPVNEDYLIMHRVLNIRDLKYLHD